MVDIRFALGISAFGILFVMCCSVFSGVRIFKDSQRKGLVLPKERETLEVLDISSNTKIYDKKYHH
jgi:hypothetical protein